MRYDQVPASNENSVTRWLADLKAGEDDAAANLWSRYFHRLVALARKRLGDSPRRVEDEEDVALSVFESLCAGAAAGRFGEIADRDDLWRLLVVITAQKSVDVVRRGRAQKRGGGKVRGESAFDVPGRGGAGEGLDQIAERDISPAFLDSLEDSFFGLLGGLEESSLQQVARLRMQGYENGEIAERMEISVRSVERKLNRIRLIWERELSS